VVHIRPPPPNILPLTKWGRGGGSEQEVSPPGPPLSWHVLINSDPPSEISHLLLSLSTFPPVKTCCISHTPFTFLCHTPIPHSFSHLRTSSSHLQPCFFHSSSGHIPLSLPPIISYQVLYRSPPSRQMVPISPNVVTFPLPPHHHPVTLHLCPIPMQYACFPLPALSWSPSIFHVYPHGHLSSHFHIDHTIVPARSLSTYAN
jgi:hypothetical protein